MKVKELIKLLSDLDPDLMIVKPGYEGGFDDPRISEVELVIDSNWDEKKKESKQWYYGRHDASSDGIRGKRTKAICL